MFHHARRGLQRPVYATPPVNMACLTTSGVSAAASLQALLESYVAELDSGCEINGNKDFGSTAPKITINAIVRERWNVLIAYCTVMDRANLTANLAKDVRGS